MGNQINLRDSFNAISDVVNNRPRPLREFDQIFMKAADMLLQADQVSKYLGGKRVVCIGDGDAIGLCLVHLHNRSLLEKGPEHLHVLDFDERVVLSVQRFAKTYNIEDRVSSELYNVADPLPEVHWQNFDGFYTNPPFGASNKGASVKAFIRRGIEAVGNSGVGCLVIADDQKHPWSQEVLRTVQNMILEEGFLIASMMPAFHKYHLDDSPELTSCSMTIRRINPADQEYKSVSLPKEQFKDFYGSGNSLKIRYVRDLTNGGLIESHDHEFEMLEGENL
ncbi:MAG TPA: bis-aminopropyl spermidine synthase family protein [Pyrinomonadaceae bacterium]|nr:bis-aminopropyl spermidine synthase family protein [Pyrinomonadaceae bacterium]